MDTVELNEGMENIQASCFRNETNVHVVYCSLPDKADWLKLTGSINADWFRSRNYLMWQDQCRFWTGRKLLALLLQSAGKNADLDAISFGKYGRPYIKNYPDFSISHSGEFVIASLTEEGMIGIDIERINDIFVNDFYQTLSENQLSIILQDEDFPRMFFRFWTIKESVVKLRGSGISLPLQKIESDLITARFNNAKYHLKELDIDSRYSCCLATDRAISALSLQRILFDTIAAS